MPKVTDWEDDYYDPVLDAEEERQRQLDDEYNCIIMNEIYDLRDAEDYDMDLRDGLFDIDEDLNEDNYIEDDSYYFDTNY